MLARAFVEIQVIGQTRQHFLPGSVGMRMGFAAHPPDESQTDSGRPVTKLAPTGASPPWPRRGGAETKLRPGDHPPKAAISSEAARRETVRVLSGVLDW